jgi:hypothetical protein
MSRDLTPKLLARPEFYFEIPEAARTFPEKDIKSFKIRAYTLQQEIDASKAAAVAGGSTEISMQAELIRRSVFEINDGAIEDMNWLDEQSPSVRALLGVGLAKATEIKKETVDAFLASMKTAVPG